VPLRRISRNGIVASLERDIAVGKKQVRYRVSDVAVNLAGYVGAPFIARGVIDAAKNVSEMDIVDGPKFIHVTVWMPGLLTQENEKGCAAIRKLEAGEINVAHIGPVSGHDHHRSVSGIFNVAVLD